MKNIKDILATYEKDMRDKVIDFRLSSLELLELDRNTLNCISYYASMFSKADTCNLETTNPVIYGVAMRRFIENTHNIWSQYIAHNTQETRSFDDAINEGLSDSFHDFRDHFVEFTIENIDDILDESDREVQA